MPGPRLKYGAVGAQDVRGVRVCLGINGDGRDLHAPQRAQDAARDDAAVGDQYALEHRVLELEMPSHTKRRTGVGL